MVQQYKEKALTIEAVVFTDVLAQSPTVANLIGATDLHVDVKNKRTVFTVEVDDQAIPYTVEEGQVVSLVGGEVVVMAADDFYAKYEAI